MNVFSQVPNPDAIIYASLGDIESLDPHWAYDEASMQITFHIYENLIKFKKNSLSEFDPVLTKKVPSEENGLIRDGGLTYIFPIRENVLFHNGNILTPEDITYSFKRSMILDRDGGPTWMLLEPLLEVSSIEDLAVELAGVESYEDLFEEGIVISKYQDIMESIFKDYIDPAITVEGENVIFHLQNPYSAFLSILAQNNSCSAIIDKAWAIEHDAWNGEVEEWWKYHDPAAEDDALYSITNGTGPFQMQRRIPGEMIQLERFDSYWQGPAKIQRVLIRIIPEWITRKLVLFNGDADIIEVTPGFINEVRDINGIRIIENLPMQSINIMHFNWTINQEGNGFIGSGKLDGRGIPPNFFNDIHVRKAFSYLFPYDAFIEKSLQGQGIRISGPMTRETLGYLDDPNFYYQQDMKKAEVEFKKAWNGELWEKGFYFNIFYTSGSDYAQTACEMIADFARMLNPKFEIEPIGINFPTMLKELYSGRLTMYNIGWQVDFPDPYAWVGGLLFSNGTLGSVYGENYQKLAQELINPLINQAIQTVNPSERELVYKQLMQIAHEQAIALYLCQHQGYHVERDWVKGWYYHPLIPMGAFAGDFYEMYKEE